MNKDEKSSEVVVSVRPEGRTTTINTLFISNSSYANTSTINSSGTWIVLECTTDSSRDVQKTNICWTAYRRYFYILDDNELWSSENLHMGRRNIWDTGQRKQKLEPVSSTDRVLEYHEEYPRDFGQRIAYTVSLASDTSRPPTLCRPPIWQGRREMSALRPYETYPFHQPALFTPYTVIKIPLYTKLFQSFLACVIYIVS